MDLGAATLAELFDGAVEANPHAEAIVDGSQRLTYVELDLRVGALAMRLHQLGVVPGDRVAALLPDGLDMIALLFACARLRAICCPMNWRLAVPELAWQIADLEPRLGVTSARFGATASEACRVLTWIDPAADLGPVLASPERPIFDDPLLILYTSGTTGRPKGAVHSQGGLQMSAVSYALERQMRRGDRTLLSAPLFHVNGLSSLLITFCARGCLVIAPQPLELDTLVRLLADEQISVWNYHPTLTLPLLEHYASARPARRLRSISLGASMHPPGVIDAVASHLSDTISFGYGQTEVGGFAIASTLAEQYAGPGLWGRPIPPFRARVVNSEGKRVAPGEVGELCMRGPSVAAGYWRNPEASAAAIEDGWLHTGDMCRRGEDGQIYFAGRKKELVKSGGENVYPLEVERVLNAHPYVVESCIVGVPDARWGEAVKAFVVLKPGAVLSRAALADWCRGQIAAYKRPRFVEFIEAVPRDFQKKPLRTQLASRQTSPDQSTEGGS